jgi:t-SNARE complex subunit (syntaxin)
MMIFSDAIVQAHRVLAESQMKLANTLDIYRLEHVLKSMVAELGMLHFDVNQMVEELEELDEGGSIEEFDQVWNDCSNGDCTCNRS